MASAGGSGVGAPVDTSVELGAPGKAYDAFISYSHAADDLLAPRLQAGLQTFAKPWWKRRALRVFRDESSLSANPHLWSSITTALDGSEWFVALLSPEAARSDWVNREIEYWLAHKDADKVLPVLTDGEFVWDSAHGVLDPNRTTAAPPALLGAFTGEPRWVDLRWGREDTQLDLRNSRFRSSIADIASAVRGIPKDDLESEEVRQHRRTVRTAWGAGVALLLLTVASIAAAVYASDQRREAETQRQMAEQQTERAMASEAQAELEAERAQGAETNAEAERGRAEEQALLARARGLAAEALTASATQLDLALLLAVQAVNTLEIPPTFEGLIGVLDRATHLVGFRPDLHEWVDGYLREPLPARYQVVAASTTGETLALGGSDGFIRVFNTRDWSLLNRPLLAAPGELDNNTSDLFTAYWISLSADGSRVAFSEPAAVYVFETDTGGQVGTRIRTWTGSRVPTAELSPDGTLVLISERTEESLLTASVWRVDDGELMGEFTLSTEVLGAGTAAFSSDGANLFMAGGEEVTAFDLASGRLTVSTRYPERRIWGAAPSPDGRLLAVVFADPLGVQIVDSSTLEPVGPMVPVDLARVDHLAFSPDGGLLAMGSEEGVVSVLDIAAGREVAEVVIGSGFPVGVAWTGDRRLLGVSANGVSEWDLTRGSPMSASVEGENVLAIAGDTELAALTGGGALSAVEAGQVLREIGRPCGEEEAPLPILGIGDGLFVVGCEGPSVRVLDGDGVTLSTWSLPAAPRAMAVDPTGNRVAFSLANGQLTAFDVGEVRAETAFAGPLEVAALAFIADGSRLVVGGRGLSGEDLALYDTSTWDWAGGLTLSEQSAYYNQTRPSITGMVLHPDAEALFVARDDGSVWRIDTATMEPTYATAVVDSPYVSLSLSPDGQRFAAASTSGEIWLWDAETGEGLGVLAADADIAPTTVWTDDGLYLIDQASGSLQRWEIGPVLLTESACRLAGRNLTASEWSKYLPGMPYQATCPPVEAET